MEDTNKHIAKNGKNKNDVFEKHKKCYEKTMYI